MEDILISGFLYKRRGGFGKMMANAWQHRYFIITDSGILCYFDSKPSDNESHSNSTNNNSNSTNNNNSVSNTNNNSGNHMLSINLIDNKPRGKIDLKAVQYELVTDLHIEGAPTSYALQITPLGDERWKLCADTKEEHSLWCNIIEKFVHHNDVPINKTDDPISYTSDDDGKHKKSVLTARGQAVTSGTTTVTSNRMRSNTNSNSNTNNNIPVVRPIKPKQGLKLKKTSSGQDTTEWLMVIIILNISIYGIVTYTNLLIKVLFVIVINIVVAHTLTLRSYRITKANATIDKIKEESLEQFSNALITNTNTTTNGTINSDKGTIINRVSVGKEVNADAPFDSNDKPSPGFTFKEVEVTDQKLAPAHTWCKCDHKLFNVRIGPDYNRFKKKAPSGPPLFEAIAVDVFW